MLVNEYEPEFQIQEFKKWKYINECVPICYKQNRRGGGTGHYLLNSTSHWSGDLTSWALHIFGVRPTTSICSTDRPALLNFDGHTDDVQGLKRILHR